MKPQRREYRHYRMPGGRLRPILFGPAADLWSQGKDTFDIADALNVHESTVANSIAEIRLLSGKAR